MPGCFVCNVIGGQDSSIRVDIREDIAGIVKARVESNEPWHGQDTSHPAGIISKEDASKCGKSTHEVGPHRHRRLNATEIARTMDNVAYCSTRHIGDSDVKLDQAVNESQS